MTGGLYLRPLGLLCGEAAREALDAGKAGALAGGPAAFALAEVIEGAPGRATREVRRFPDLAASAENELAELLARVTSPRPAIAGLALDRIRLMGVVNVTPDSFSDGGLYDRTEEAIAHGATLIKEGADIIDIGGESTRPGADPVDPHDEAERALPVIEGLRGVKAVLSLDSRNAQVMRRAAAAGVHMLNDVSALVHDPESLETAANSGLPVVVMHALGDPKTMQDDPVYEDVVLEVYDFLAGRVAACEAGGIGRDRLIADPGIGFGKTFEHNLALMRSLTVFHGLGLPLLVGASRKRFIGVLMDENEPRKRLTGSLAAALAAAGQGVHILRVHDVRETRQALTVWEALR